MVACDCLFVILRTRDFCFIILLLL